MQLTRIARALARQSASQESVTIKHFFQKLSINLQRANASMLLSRQTHFPDRECDGVRHVTFSSIHSFRSFVPLVPFVPRV